MFQKSFKISFQRLVSHKAYSAINIGGLAIALSVCMVILLYTNFHASFDKYIPDVENSYRCITRVGSGTYSAHTFAGFEDALSNIPEIESFSLFYTNHNIEDVFINEKKVKVDAAIFANESFLDYFGIKMIEGDRTSINQPNTIMLTPKMAKKLFPEEKAIGKTVFLRSFTSNQDSLIAYSVSGIINPLPAASHVQYEMLISRKGHFSPTVRLLKSRKIFGGNLYLKLLPSANVKEVEEKLTKGIEPILKNAFGPPLNAFNHSLQAVCDIHFTPSIRQGLHAPVRRSSHNILILVGLLIFVLATMNFIIMHIARSSFYQKSKLIIRFFGGTKKHLIGQTITEVFISVSISFLFSFAMLVLFQNYWSTKFFSNWQFSFQSASFWFISISLFIIVNMLVSTLSSLNLVKKGSILKQFNQESNFKAAIYIVIFQFIMVITLIAFTLVINLQMNYIDKKELGFTKDNILIIKVPQVNAKVNLLKEELAKLPYIESTGTAQHYPGYRLQDMNFSVEETSYPFKFGFFDLNAIKTLNIKVIKYFSPAKEKAVDGWFINETFYKNLRSNYSEEQIATSNFPEDENQAQNEADQRFIIHGVISDFHYASLHSGIENFALYARNTKTRFNRFVLVRFSQNNWKNIAEPIERKIEEIYPGQPMNYVFLDEQLNKSYASEQTLLKLINAFSILSILVACFGLIGLSIFITEKRTKEIGIRKVNGATVSEIIKLLNLYFIKKIVISFFIACPLAFYISKKWLENFAYKITLDWWIFALAGISALVIATITVSWLTFKAARKNPVNALRYE